MRNILLALLSSLAKLEAQKIGAQANGIRIDCPKLDIELWQRMADLAAKSETPYANAKVLGIDRHTAAKYWPVSEPCGRFEKGQT